MHIHDLNQHIKMSSMMIVIIFTFYLYVLKHKLLENFRKKNLCIFCYGERKFEKKHLIPTHEY